MMNKILNNDTPYPSQSHFIHTPDGKCVTNVTYDPEDMSILHIEMNIGKAGSSVAAWSNGFTRMIMLALRQGVPLDVVIAELSDISTDRFIIKDGITCRSGPEALAIVLRTFRSFVKGRDYGKDKSL